MRYVSNDSGVSPVVGVILVVAITVILSTAIGMFVLNLGDSITQSNSQQGLGLKTDHNTTHMTAQVITGSAERVELRINGTVEDTLTNPSPGDTLSAKANADSTVAIVATTDGESRLLSTRNPFTGSTMVSGSSTNTNGLVALYKLDSGPNDSYGTHDGTNAGATFVTDSQRGGVAEISASETDHISVPHADALNQTGAFTVVAWVNYSTNSSWQAIYTKGKSVSSSRNWWLGVRSSTATDPNGVHFSIPDTSGNNWFIDGPQPVAGEGWTHVVGVFTGDELRLYINGSLDGTNASGAFTPQTSDALVGIGATHEPSDNSWYQHSSGRLDDVRLYDRALSQSEVEDLYNSTK